MSVPCPTCLPLDCALTEDTDLYSLGNSLFPFVLNCPPGYDCGTATGINMVCCGQVLSAQFPLNATVDDKLAIIQELVNQCGVRQLFCGGTTTQLFYNRTKTCTVPCPDGSPFVYTVAAGTFLGPDQATVDQQAADFACVQAGLRKVCLGPLSACLCVGGAYDFSIQTSGGIGPFTWSVSAGVLPPGLTLDQTGTVSGTPTTPGGFAFGIQATEPDGSYVRKLYSMTILAITNTSLPDYVVGTPYLYQLTVTGGSGLYAIKLISGVFPDGIVMDATGLIHGTATGLNSGTMPLVFDFIDTNCTAIDRSFFVPRATLTGQSVTTIATVRGYPEYIASEPPKKYHRITWTGEASQVGNWSFTSETFEWYLASGVPQSETQMCNAKYVYSGTGEISGSGNQTSNYHKDYFGSCPKFSPLFDTNIFVNPFFVKGYCWKYDPNSCPTCDDPPPLVNNLQQNIIKDIPYDLMNGSDGVTLTPTTLVQDVSQTLLVHLRNGGGLGANNFPPATWNGIQGPWPFITVEIHITATLDAEYTDVEALANARIINSNGTTAEAFARTTGYVSRWTTVAFDLSFSNLVVGQAYVASVDLFDSSGVHTPKNYAFTASGTTKTITDSVPTPAQGHTITVRKPTVAFAP